MWKNFHKLNLLARLSAAISGDFELYFLVLELRV